MSRVFLFYIFLFSIFLAIQSEQAVQSDSSPSAPAAAETKDDDGILLTSIKELSFYYNRYVRSAHEEKIPQMKCMGGTAGCSIVPRIAVCRNRANDNSLEPRWECKANLPRNITFGDVFISCEGYSEDDDGYILKGSCSLEYTLQKKEFIHLSTNKSRNVIRISFLELILVLLVLLVFGIKRIFAFLLFLFCFPFRLMQYLIYYMRGIHTSFSFTPTNKVYNPFILSYEPRNNVIPSPFVLVLLWGLLGLYATKKKQGTKKSTDSSV